MPKGKKVNIPEDNLRELHNDGMTIKEMANYFNCCGTVINHRLKKYGISRIYQKGNLVIHRGDHLEIFLNHGYTCLIDREDWAKFKLYTWCIRKSRCGNVYARTATGGKCMLMHRFILDAKDDDEIDHKNRNGLDNRRSNIRFCTRSENIANSRSCRGGTSKYKGVSWNKECNSWVASYKKPIKHFENEEMAARCYDLLLLEEYPEFANTNFPKEDYVDSYWYDKINSYKKLRKTKKVKKYKYGYPGIYMAQDGKYDVRYKGKYLGRRCTVIGAYQLYLKTKERDDAS